ncbi:MAG: peptidase S24, partial [Burkholderiales bacterium]
MARVHGVSMHPGLRDGDRLVVVHDVPARVGDVVVARLPDTTVALKRIESIDEAGVWLASDNASVGWSSRAWGCPVARDDVLAVARFRLWPTPRVIRRST